MQSLTAAALQVPPSMLPERTAAQLLQALAAFADAGGGRCNPTLRALASAMRVSRRTVMRALARLQRRGLVTWRRIRGAASEYHLRLGGGDTAVAAGGDRPVTSASPGGDTPGTTCLAGGAGSGDTRVTGVVTPVSPSGVTGVTHNNRVSNITTDSAPVGGSDTGASTGATVGTDGLQGGDMAGRVTHALGEWNALAGRCELVPERSPDRRLQGRLARRLQGCSDREWRAALGAVEASDFLCGRTGAAFRARLCFLLNDEKWRKLWVGDYGARPVVPPTAEEEAATRRLAAEREARFQRWQGGME